MAEVVSAKVSPTTPSHTRRSHARPHPSPATTQEESYGRLVVIKKTGKDGAICEMNYDQLLIGRYEQARA